MKKNRTLEVIYSITGQLTVIVALFLWLFAIAPFSYHVQAWSDEVVRFVQVCNIINPIVFSVLIVTTIVCAIKLKKIGKPGSAVVCSVVIFAVSIAIRINMLGTYQWSDAQLYYTQMDRLTYCLDGMLFDTFKSGFIFGHISHGFIFVTMLGQLLNVPDGMGFQYSYMVMGAVAAVCLFYIFKKVFPKKKDYICAIAAFIVSVHPIFLGLSTSMHMEYPLAVLFIYVLCAYLSRKYILMIFWLIMLGTCKETGAMMSFSMLFFAVVYELMAYVKKCGGVKDFFGRLKPGHYIGFGVFLAVCVVAFIKIINVPMWGGNRIIDVLKVGGEGTMNFQFNSTHFMMKVRQLFVLNFSWLWALMLIVCIIVCLAVPSVRGRKEMDKSVFSFILIQYAVYTFFLLFFLEAKQTRYNILSDTLFLFMVMAMVIRALDRWFAFVPVSFVIAGLSFAETFVTIDPVSLAVFSTVNTGGRPMVWTAATKKEVPLVDINIGDFGYYNYQYTYMDKAVDQMLESVDYQEWFRVLSSFDGVENQFGDEAPVWDSKLKQRTYYTYDEDGRFYSVKRLNYKAELEQWDLDDRCIYVEIPWCRNHTEDAKKALRDYYIFEGPYTSSVGSMCSLTYYILYLR